MSNKNSNQISTSYVVIAFSIFFALTIPFLSIDPLLSLFLILIVATILLALIDPKLSLFALLLIRPILDFSSEKTLFEIGNIPVNLAALLGIILPVIAFFLFTAKKRDFSSFPLLKNWVFFLLLVFFSLLFSFNRISSISEIVRLSTIFAIFLLSLLTIKTTKDFFGLLKVIVFSMLIPVGVALYQLLTKTGLTLSFQDTPNRLFGTFAHPNLFAFSLTHAIAIALILILVSKKHPQRAFWSSFLLMFLFCLTLTYTRGAWILFVFLIFFAGILKLRKLLIFSVFAFFSLYLLASPFRERIDSITTLSPYSSISWRFNLWSDAIDYSRDALFLGHGTGTAGELIFERRGSTFGSTAPHNDFLKILLENGIFGLLAFIAIPVTLSKYLFSKLKKRNLSEDYYLIVLVSLCFTLGLYFASFGDNILEATALQWTFWAQIGGLLAVLKTKKQALV